MFFIRLSNSKYTSGTEKSVKATGKEVAVVGSFVTTCNDMGLQNNSMVVAVGMSIPAMIPPVKKSEGKKEDKKQEKKVSKTEEITVEFKYKSKFDEKEFSRQLSNQEKGMNKLTVKEYLENRKNYKANGRDPRGSAAQKNAREKALFDKRNELLKEKKNYAEADRQAKDWIKTKAALHDPDQIAGGDPTKITGFGDSRINSSLGSQWKTRIGNVDEKVEALAKDLTEEQQMTTYLNIRLIY